MTASADDVNVDDLRRRARRRLVGAIVLALGAAVFVPMLLESDPKPLGEDVAVKIPPVDEGKFVNRLTEKGKSDPAKPSPVRSDAAKADGAKGDAHPTDSAKADPQKGETAKADAPKDEPRTEAAKADAPKEAPSAEAPKESAPLPAKRTIAEAEQKMLGAPAKAAPAPATAAKSLPAPAASTPPAPPPSAQGDAVAGFSVQLAAFSDDKGANALANKLKKAGYAAYTEPLETSKGTLWRVRVGPYPSRDAAVAGRDKLKGEGYSGIVAAAR